MRICIVNPFYDSVPETHLEVVGRYRHVEALALALARRGHRVGVVQAFREDRVEEHHDVNFVHARTPHRSAARLAGGPIGIDLLFSGNLARVIEAIDVFAPDAVHMNGLTLLQPLSAIGRWCHQRKVPLTVSYHGGGPRGTPWLHQAQKTILGRCSRVLFTTISHAAPWISRGLLRPEQVAACLEVSSTFAATDRALARSRTGMKGSPVFAWNAGLLPDKDPLTALKGFSLIRRSWPDARLYMIYVNSQMLTDVENMIASDPHLQNSVELRGRIPHDAVQDFFNSSDFMIQSSRREVAGFSVLEAMSCGVIPVVTDIPAFQHITNNGRYGILFPVGDYEAMAASVLRVPRGDAVSPAHDVLRFFSSSLSYDAIAVAYENLLRQP